MEPCRHRLRHTWETEMLLRCKLYCKDIGPTKDVHAAHSVQTGVQPTFYTRHSRSPTVNAAIMHTPTPTPNTHTHTHTHTPMTHTHTHDTHPTHTHNTSCTHPHPHPTHTHARTTLHAYTHTKCYTSMPIVLREKTDWWPVEVLLFTLPCATPCPWQQNTLKTMCKLRPTCVHCIPAAHTACLAQSCTHTHTEKLLNR